MKDDASSQGWELEDTGDTEDRWVLEESEQQLADEWDLEGTPEPVGQWQPVEYDKPRRGGPAWILPTLVTLALLAVLAYSGFMLVPELIDTLRDRAAGITGNFQEEQQPTPEESVAAVGETVTETPTGEPTVTSIPSDTPTAEPPTATPVPTLAAAQKLFATVLSEYGVNARSAPSLEAEVTEILEQDATFVVLEQLDDDWLMLFIADGPLESGQPISGYVGYASAEFFATALQPLADAIWLAILNEAGIAPTATPAPPTPTAEPTVEPTVATDLTLPTVTPIAPATSDTATDADTGAVTETLTSQTQDTVTVLIDAVSGLNVRTQPELNADVVTLLTDGSEVPAIGRYATNEWILVDLGDGATGWVFTELVTLNGELSSLPAITLGELAPPSPTPTETATPEPTPIATPVEPPEPYSSVLPAGVPGVVVFSALGVNARQSPDANATVITILPENAALPAVGRTANGEWVQVELPQGGVAWVFRATIIPRGDINSVPVADGNAGTVAPTATTAPEPETVATAAPAQPTAAATTAPAAEPTAEATAETANTVSVTMRKVVVPVYAIPDAEGERLVQYGLGTQLQATGQSADGVWIRVITADGQNGWVSAKSVEISGDAGSLPIVQ